MAVPFSLAPESRYNTSATVVLEAMVCGVVLKKLLNNVLDAPITCTPPVPLIMLATDVSEPKLNAKVPLLMMLADEVNMVPDQLIGNLGDTHLYNNHIEQAKEQISRESFELPSVHVRDGIFCSSINDIILENYQSHPAIKAP